MREHSLSIALLMITLMQLDTVSAQPAGIAMPNAFPGAGGFPPPPVNAGLPPAYPAWPERTVRSEIVPPPPPGPYMSSAMTGINVFPESTAGLRKEESEEHATTPFIAEQMPWPDTPEYASPQQWMPESGEYQYVPDDLVHKLESSLSNIRQEYPARRPYRGYPPVRPMRPPRFSYY